MERVASDERRVLVGVDFAARARRSELPRGGVPRVPRLRLPTRESSGPPLKLRQPKPSNSRALDAPLHDTGFAGDGDDEVLDGDASLVLPALPAPSVVHRQASAATTARAEGVPRLGTAASLAGASLGSFGPFPSSARSGSGGGGRTGGGSAAGVHPSERIASLYSVEAGALSPRTLLSWERASVASAREAALVMSARAHRARPPETTRDAARSRRQWREKLRAMADESGVTIAGPRRPTAPARLRKAGTAPDGGSATRTTLGSCVRRRRARARWAFVLLQQLFTPLCTRARARVCVSVQDADSVLSSAGVHRSAAAVHRVGRLARGGGVDDDRGCGLPLPR